jgi:hypothetical protein
MGKVPRCGLIIQLLLEYLEQDSSPTISDVTTNHHGNVDRPKFEDGTITSALSDSGEIGGQTLSTQSDMIWTESRSISKLRSRMGCGRCLVLRKGNDFYRSRKERHVEQKRVERFWTPWEMSLGTICEGTTGMDSVKSQHVA